MGIQNSRFQEILDVLRQMFVDLSLASLPLVMDSEKDCKSRREAFALREAQLDFRYVSRRTESEGFQFLTITLPRLGKWLDQLLEFGKILPPPEGFAPYGEDGLPEFMRFFWDALKHHLEPATGSGEQLARAIRIARSILFSCYKLEVPSTDEQNKEAIRRFEWSDSACGVLWCPEVQEHTRVMGALIADVLTGFDPYDIVPRHGPGAVATGERQEEKWRFKRLYPSLHQKYPYYDYMYGIRQNGCSDHLRDCVEQYLALERGAVPTSKVVLVPKDSRGPRIICEEPLEIQYIQQGVARALMEFLERGARENIVRGHVNFSDQGINRDLARRSSLDGSLATLDMKDASDLVSLELVKAVFPPHMVEVLLATRSTHTCLPDGRVLKLRKYAPMGSALCFPIESLVFWASCVSSLIKSGVPFGVALRRVWVYGDDIIVPTEHVRAVIHGLEGIGLAVNFDKSCYRANFRESCGLDAWRGNIITPVRIRKFPGQRPSDGTRHAAWCQLASRLYESGMVYASMAAMQVVNRALGPIPITRVPMGYLSFVIPDFAWSLDDYKRLRWNPRYQSLEARLWCLREKTRPTRLESWERLCERLQRPLAEDCDPSEVVVPSATQMKKRWIGVEFDPYF